MARLWDEIQRDKHIFPYVQFIVVKDNHTSEICSPLHNVIVSVDDPMLLVYFPPNHFNCRTTIKKLRRGVPTKGWIRPNIPEAFKNNPAITGKVFSEDNSYIENTPNDVLLYAAFLYNENKRNKRYEEIQFKALKSIKKGLLEFFTSGKQSKAEFKKNKETFTLLAGLGQRYRMLPIINDGLKNPDGLNLITNKFTDIKISESINGKNIISEALKQASKQEAKEVIVRLVKKPKSYREMYNALMLILKENRNKNIEDIVIIFPNNDVKKYTLDRVNLKIKKAQI